LKHVESIARRLVEAGRRADEPVAVVSKATTPEQRVVETTLASVAAVAAALEPPALLVIGETVRLRAGLDWLGAIEGRLLVADPLGLGAERETG
jgi:uroporphyrin-III C-methyltransferase